VQYIVDVSHVHASGIGFRIDELLGDGGHSLVCDDA
jgi:hypothetical protein